MGEKGLQKVQCQLHLGLSQVYFYREPKLSFKMLIVSAQEMLTIWQACARSFKHLISFNFILRNIPGVRYYNLFL